MICALMGVERQSNRCFPLSGRRVFVAGHSGLVGSALTRRLSDENGAKILTVSRGELDLRNGPAVTTFLEKERPDAVIVAAGRVGGIGANRKQPADFIYDNLMIEANVIHAAWKAGVRRLVNFGSGCVYPRECSQPMRPEQIGTGPMEPTSEPYSTAKLAGMIMCDAYRRQHGVAYINVIPAGVYGPGDCLDPERAHVVTALMRRFHEAKQTGASEVVLWGSGRPQRELLYVDDLAEAVLLLLERYDGEAPVNAGSGQVCSIAELAACLVEVTGFKGRIAWDTSKPDGAAAKTLDWTPLRQMGWNPRTGLAAGLRRTYEWFASRVSE
ncbi:MAG: GDP-L-fucose synthase [Verrucomicrobiae bacterium]|nr:GDP-L-fucose synthase [Verrucomicrobiae bacterium]